jgi:hypothetical protein
MFFSFPIRHAWVVCLPFRVPQRGEEGQYFTPLCAAAHVQGGFVLGLSPLYIRSSFIGGKPSLSILNSMKDIIFPYDTFG